MKHQAKHISTFVYVVFLSVLGSAYLFATDPPQKSAKKSSLEYRNMLSKYQKRLANDEEISYKLKVSLQFNIAQCYFGLDSLNQASAAYLAVISRLPSHEQSIAYNNLGILELKLKNQKGGLSYFRSAILADLKNESAKRNYELLKKRLKKPPPPPPSQIPPPPVGGAGKGSPLPTEHLGKSWKFEPLTEKQALHLLEQHAHREQQYLQQLRKSYVNDKKYSSDPQY